MEEILALRHELAQTAASKTTPLNFLADEMAENPQQVRRILPIWLRARHQQGRHGELFSSLSVLAWMSVRENKTLVLHTSVTNSCKLYLGKQLPTVCLKW